MSAENKALVRRFFDEVCNKRQLGLADQFFATNHAYHDPSSPWIGPGPQGMKELVGVYQSAFPDSHWQVEDMVDSGDTVVTRWTGRGTHSAELLGIAPTGRQVKVAGVWIHRFSGHQIAESWNVWDTLGMLQQLGAVPPLGQPSGQSAG
jgi:steroid delta-isomerase-like uncharacterized protein